MAKQWVRTPHLDRIITARRQCLVGDSGKKTLLILLLKYQQAIIIHSLKNIYNNYFQTANVWIPIIYLSIPNAYKSARFRKVRPHVFPESRSPKYINVTLTESISNGYYYRDDRLRTLNKNDNYYNNYTILTISSVNESYNVSWSANVYNLNVFIVCKLQNSSCSIRLEILLGSKLNPFLMKL